MGWRLRGLLVFEAWLPIEGASIQPGESAEPAVEPGLEEVVTGEIPVPRGDEAVEQPVQGGEVASQRTGFVPTHQNSLGKEEQV